MEVSCGLYNAAKYGKWMVIKKYLKDGGNINANLVSIGPEAGYTALHFAAMEKDKKLVKKLVDCGANVNSMSENGVQPIHLACLLKNYSVTEALLGCGANPDAQVTRQLVDKYAKDKKWSDEFGGTMPLLAFVIINDNVKLTEALLTNKANLEIKTTQNKTLLMYAVENSTDRVVELLLIQNNYYLGWRDSLDKNGWHTLSFMQPIQRSPLFFKLLPMNLEYSTLEDTQINILKLLTRDFIKLIFENYAFRREFKIFIPEEEKKLMDHLVATNEKIRKTVEDFDNNFINGTLKKKVIVHGSWGKITLLCEAVEKIFDKKSLKLLVKNESLVRAYKFLYHSRYKYEDNKLVSLVHVMIKKIENAFDRRLILEEVGKIRDLRKAVHLPYELVLMIIEYLDNDNLINFVKAFHNYDIPYFERFRL